MKKDFDHIAKNYDTDFTYSEIGKKQRNSVYRYLQKLPNNLNILELNCGTGKDAIWFSKRGNTILATDISNEMIQVAKQKAKKIDNLEFRQLDINKIDVRLLDLRLKDERHKTHFTSIQGVLSNINVISSGVEKSHKFNLIFSNFGGLNCLNSKELHDFFKNTSKLITSNGKLILVIMPKNTLWENLYFSLKGKFKTAFRRNTNKALAVNVENTAVKTWYYNPKDIKALAEPYFKVIKTKPIGFFIPPSYLENYFKRNKRLLRILDKLEKRIGNFSFLSRFSDHYLIEIQPNFSKGKE